MSKKIHVVSLTMMLCLGQLAPTFSQEQKTPAATPSPASTADPQEEDTIRVGTAAVQLEAIVTDKSGRRINGLTATDFQVVDEGMPRTLDYFTAIEGSRRVTSPTSAAAANESDKKSGSDPVSPLVVPYQGRHLALVFDDLNLTNDNFLRSRRAFADYINTKLTPNDMVALVSTGGALASMQQFTNDKQRLLSALNRIAAQTRVAGNRPWGITDTEAIRIDSGDTVALNNVMRRAAITDAGPTATLIDQAAGDRPRNARTDVGGPDNGVDESKIRTTARAIVSEIGQGLLAKLDTLESLFRGMADLPGRKIVILMTESFITGGGTSADISNRLTQLIEIGRRGGVSVYALDAVGLRTENVSASEHTTGTALAFKNVNPDLTMGGTEQLGGARALVSGTGGEFIANTNSLIAGVERAIEDSSSYYVIGFRPDKLDNKFHRLAVTVKGKPDLIVRTRRGYLAVNPETVRGTDAELAQALRSPVPLMDLPVELVANVVPTANGEQVVNIGLHVGRNYLTLPAATAADQTAAYEVVSYVFASGRDKPVGGVVKTMTYDLAKDMQARQKLKTEGFTLVPQPFTALEPGVYQMRAVVREKSSGSVGTAYQFFEVPNLKDRKTVSMSSIVLTAAGQTGFNGTNSFKPGTDVNMRFNVYHLPKDGVGVTQRVKLMDATGKVLFDSELAIAPPSGSDKMNAPQGTSFNLPPTRGRYSLIVTLKDAKGKIDVERRTDLVIN